MKKNFLFQRTMRVLLAIAILGSFLAVPTQPHSVLAKSPSATFTTCAAQGQIPATECDALVALYNSANGAGWTDHTNWLQTDTPCNWVGVVCGIGINVTELHLSWNRLSGSIPTGLGNLTQLEWLDLSGNALSGSIPSQLGNLTQLYYLNLGTNALTGSIPAGLGNLTQLTALVLSTNALTGSIPPELGNLSVIKYLYLDRNRLTGRLPTQLGSLAKLVALFLEKNQLTGEIPVSFTNLTSLGWLTLSCGLDSSNPAVIAFINHLIPGWQDHLCLPVTTLTLISIADQDGWIIESSETSGVGGARNNTAIAINLGDNQARRQYLGILSFASGAALPDTAVITGLTLKVKKQGVTGGGDPLATFQGFMVDIKNGFFGSTSVLQIADFQAAAGNTYGPFTPAPVSNWYTLDLTGAGPFVNKLTANSGLTQIRLRFKLDDNNDAVANYLSLFSGSAPAVDRPQLIVTYYVP